ncbi:GNAT superfamily N-acetyltransferase [Bradyrhizobium sp. GM0.4]
MTVVCRPARADDLEAADALVVSSINDLTVRHGFGQMASPSPPNFQMFSLADDPDGLWVAEDDGRIVGFAWSWVCGDIWFLAQLFISPERQGGSIGRELIETDSGSRREVRRFQQGSDHLCLQYRVAGALHPPRAVSAISDLQRQRAPRAFDRSPPWPAIQMRSARRRSLDVGSLRVIGRAGAWGVPREASPLSDQR